MALPVDCVPDMFGLAIDGNEGIGHPSRKREICPHRDRFPSLAAAAAAPLELHCELACQKHSLVQFVIIFRIASPQQLKAQGRVGKDGKAHP